MSEIERQIEELVSSRQKFNEFVYTPLDKALEEIKTRRANPDLVKEVDGLLNNDIPECFNTGPKAVIFSQVSPNYELRRFMSLIDAIEELLPVFLEYCDDKFVPENDWKYSLGKLKFFYGRGKHGGLKIERVNIIDFNKSNGRKLSEITTLWGQKLLDFHHEFFDQTFKKLKPEQCSDISNWLKLHGGTPMEYYKHVLLLMIKQGILFENFMLYGHEEPFTRNIFLPAFIQITNDLKMKPLIVALEPTEIEGDTFWTCYPSESRWFMEEKKKQMEI